MEAAVEEEVAADCNLARSALYQWNHNGEVTQLDAEAHEFALNLVWTYPRVMDGDCHPEASGVEKGAALVPIHSHRVAVVDLTEELREVSRERVCCPSAARSLAACPKHRDTAHYHDLGSL